MILPFSFQIKIDKFKILNLKPKYAKYEIIKTLSVAFIHPLHCLFTGPFGL